MWATACLYPFLEGFTASRAILLWHVISHTLYRHPIMTKSNRSRSHLCLSACLPVCPSTCLCESLPLSLTLSHSFYNSPSVKQRNQSTQALCTHNTRVHTNTHPHTHMYSRADCGLCRVYLQPGST